MRTQIVWWKRGTAGIAGALCIAALAAVVLLATSAGGSSGGYTVRAIFFDAGNLIAGEDVLIDGVKAGKVGEVVATPHARAAVTLEIENPGFQDFRADATCTIKIQSLIGEKDVDCLPTQQRAVGTPLPPPLPKIPSGQEGAGQYLMNEEHTSSPVDVDLLGDITRLPEAQRLTIILNELGAGLAGRGSDLHAAIISADPALRELTDVVTILASERKTLENLAIDSDQALAPLAKVKEQISDWIYKANVVATATANQRGALAQNLALLPKFLREFGPAMQRLGALGEQIAPTSKYLGIAAPGLAKTFKNIGPFSTATTKFLESLGKTSKVTGPAVVAAQPFFKHVQTLGAAAQPFASNTSALLTSARETGGIERLVDAIFNGAGATNGYDALGHFLRGMAVINPTCLSYAITVTAGCNGRFSSGTSAGKAAAASVKGPTTDLVMERTLAVLRGDTPAQAIARYPGVVLPGSGGFPLAAEGPTGSPTPVGGSSGGTTYYSPSTSESPSASGLLLNYLLGN